MAHDEHDPASQDPISREALEDQVLEEKPSAERRTGSLDESRNGPDHNAHPVDILSNDRNIDDSKNDDNHSFALSSSGLRVSENLNVEEGESTRQFGFKPRTIPGMFGHTRVLAGLLWRALANARVCACSMDSIS